MPTVEVVDLIRCDCHVPSLLISDDMDFVEFLFRVSFLDLGEELGLAHTEPCGQPLHVLLSSKYHVDSSAKTCEYAYLISAQ